MGRVKYVPQETTTSCGVACFSMLSSVPFKKALGLFHPGITKDQHYTTWGQLKKYLSKYNIEYSELIRGKKKINKQRGKRKIIKCGKKKKINKQRSKWLWPKGLKECDFAIVAVQYTSRSKYWHYIVWNKKTGVMDPGDKRIKRLEFYYRIISYMPVLIKD